MRNTNSERKSNTEGKNARAAVSRRTDVSQTKCKENNKRNFFKMYEPDIAVGQKACFYNEDSGVYIEGEISFINHKRRWFLIERKAVNRRSSGSASVRASFNFCELYATSYRGVRSVLWTEEDLQWLEACKRNAVRKNSNLADEIKLACHKRAAGISCDEEDETVPEADAADARRERSLSEERALPEEKDVSYESLTDEEVNVSDDVLKLDDTDYDSLVYSDEYGFGEGFAFEDIGIVTGDCGNGDFAA